MGDEQAALWMVFSRVVKPEKTIRLKGVRSDPKALYNFHEAVVDALRPALGEGVRSIIVASPAKTNHARSFIDHVRRHHMWLIQGPSKAVFSEATGSAAIPSEVAALTRTPAFHRLISETTSEEAENLVEVLEKHLGASNRVLYSLEEIAGLVLGPCKPGISRPEYLILTDKYLSDSREKNRVHRLMQIAKNKSVKTRIVEAESAAGIRLTQLGGIVCLCAP